MNKKIVLSLLAVAVVVVIALKMNKPTVVPVGVSEPAPGAAAGIEEAGGVVPDSAPAGLREIIVEGSNFKFAPATLTVAEGERIRLIFKNTGGNHDWKVDELNVATKIIRGGEQDIIEFIPDKKGTFEFYCSVGTHRAMGMKGTIIVQ